MSHTVTAADHGFDLIDGTTAVLPEFVAAVEALRATNEESVTFMISTQYTNLLSVRCATALADELRSAEFRVVADAIGVALMQTDSVIGHIVITREPGNANG